ncbi:hypothetical protein [Halalkalibacter sp. APA_J-10(15)]|uniref:hypothetical protein n=1 Tax=Halalkalibacter sp. APA_J-10(15) TaxID=2933805 RepID=UPI001FF4E446|nr:hypothetical protein [Halalkalibacter sp. APA_J-10(15)]MCK0470896.1 hypothetical protein [Halalkalibacter sp. APA_J-10(15)]
MNFFLENITLSITALVALIGSAIAFLFKMHVYFNSTPIDRLLYTEETKLAIRFLQTLPISVLVFILLFLSMYEMNLFIEFSNVAMLYFSLFLFFSIFIIILLFHSMISEFTSKPTFKISIEYGKENKELYIIKSIDKHTVLLCNQPNKFSSNDDKFFLYYPKKDLHKKEIYVGHESSSSNLKNLLKAFKRHKTKKGVKPSI